jgi:hypothetical protein
MTRILRALVVALLGGCLAACATTGGPDVHSTFDQATDFAQYRTFGFVEPAGTDQAGYETLVTQQLKSAARRELEARGYAFSGTAPDLLVNFNASLAQQVLVTDQPVPMSGYYNYRTGTYGGWVGYEPDVEEYIQGTLNIDLVDARRNQLVWEGVAVGRITQQVRQHRAAAIDKAVAEIFAKYPFRAGE